MEASMQATRLESYYRRICENERTSRLRNEQLLRDLDRIESHSIALQHKGLQLANAKAEYEAYLESRYPRWKEKALQRLNESNFHGESQKTTQNWQPQHSRNINASNLQEKINPELPQTNDLLFSNRSNESALSDRSLNNMTNAPTNGSLLSDNNFVNTNVSPTAHLVTSDQEATRTVNRDVLQDPRAGRSEKRSYQSGKTPMTSEPLETIPIVVEASAGNFPDNYARSMLHDDSLSSEPQKSTGRASDGQKSIVKPSSSSNNNNFIINRPENNFTVATAGPTRSANSTLSPREATKGHKPSTSHNTSVSPRDLKATKTGSRKSKTASSPRQSGIVSAVSSMGAPAVVIASPAASISTGMASPRNSTDNASLRSREPASLTSDTLRDSLNMADLEDLAASEVVRPRGFLDRGATGSIGSVHAGGAISPREAAAGGGSTPRGSVATNRRGSVASEISSPRGLDEVISKPAEPEDIEEISDIEVPNQSMDRSREVKKPQPLEQTDRTEIEDVSDFESDISLTNHQPPMDPLSSLTLSANHTPANITMPNQSESTWTAMQASNKANDDNADLYNDDDDDWDDFSGMGRDSANLGVSHVPSKMASLTQSSAYRQLLADVSSSREGGAGLTDLHTETETEDEIERNLKSHHDAKHGSLLATLNSTAGSRTTAASESAAAAAAAVAAAVTPRSSRSAIQSIAEDSDLEDEFSPPQSLSYLNNNSSKAKPQLLQSPPPNSAAAAAAAATARAIAGDDFWD